MKNFRIELQSQDLNKLLTALSDEMEFTENDVFKAVGNIGRNVTKGGEIVWVLNKELALNSEGELVKVKDYGLLWLGHISDTDAVSGLAKEERGCKVHLPLGKEEFHLMCHFLRANVHVLDTEKIRNLNSNLPEACQFPTDMTAVDREPESEEDKRNFLSQFYIVASSAIVANFVEVSISNSI